MDAESTLPVDRDQRLQALTLQHQQIVIEMRNKYESKLEDLGHSSDVKLKGVLEIADQLKRELSEALQSSDKHRNAVVHLKQQLQVRTERPWGCFLLPHFPSPCPFQKQLSDEWCTVV